MPEQHGNVVEPLAMRRNGNLVGWFCPFGCDKYTKVYIGDEYLDCFEVCYRIYTGVVYGSGRCSYDDKDNL